jgi:hypothetical protein
MKIINEVNHETVREACRIVGASFKHNDFLNSLLDINFNFTHESGYEVAKNTEVFEGIVYVKPYTTFSPWSKVIGYAQGNTIFVNTRKLDLPLKDRVENIRHEIFHLQGYSHKGNRVNAYNLQTVPFKAAAIFVKYLESIGKL